MLVRKNEFYSKSKQHVVSVATPMLFPDILESLAQNGKHPNENGNHVNGEGPRTRHRGREVEPEVSAQGAAESSKPYTGEQLEAVRKLVHTNKGFPLH